MRVLVTGAGGFIGSALSRALLADGHQVVGLTRNPEQAAARIGQKLELISGGIGHPKDIAKAAQSCELLINASGVPPITTPPRVLKWLHVAGAENVIRAARHARVDRVIHIGCAEVSLSDEDRMHWDEKRVLPRAPLGPFAQSKLTAEELVLAQSDAQLEVVALRPSLVWGAGDVDGITRLAQGLKSGAFKLYGGGRNIISTTHIDNLCKAALLAIDAEDAPSRAYYVTDGEFLDAREFYQKLTQALGLPMPKLDGNLTMASLRAAFAARLLNDEQPLAELARVSKSALFDVSRAVHDLGYEPHIDLAQKLSELTRWVESEGGLAALAQRARKPPQASDVDEQVRAAGGD